MPPTISNPEPGFVSLFNGKDLSGWRYPAEDKFDGKTESSDKRYSVANGISTGRIRSKEMTTAEIPCATLPTQSGDPGCRALHGPQVPSAPLHRGWAS